MKNILSIPVTLMTVAILSACTSASKNPNLLAAHNSYDTARANPTVVELAPLELQGAINAQVPKHSMRWPA